MKPVIIIAIAFVFLFVPITTFAESESMIVAARSYEQIQIYMNSGDELEFSIQVDGGKNDDINLIIGIPGQDVMEGRVVVSHSDTFTAPSSGSYVFTFDNTISKISNKSVLFSYDITKNTYYVYVENVPEYAKDHAANAVLDATEYWKSVFPKKNFYVVDSKSNADTLIQWVKDFTGMKHVGFQYVRLIEIGLGDSKCLGQWNPYSSKHVTEITTHEIGHAIGLEHSDNPNSIMYPTASRTEYGNVSQQFNMGKNQGMFIPLCLSKEPSSIQYSIDTTDSKSGFDVYVIPSKKDFDNIMQGKSFVYYSDDSCFGEGFLKYFGQCDGVVNESGLAIIHDSQLSSSTASISVNYFEVGYDNVPSPFDTKIHSQIHETATLDVIIFGDQIDFSYSMYQNKDDSIRFEDGNGYIIHRYDSTSTMLNLFNSFGMAITPDCFILADNRSFCENDDYSLEFFVNNQKINSLSKYVFNDGDQITIKYGSKPISSTSQSTSIPEIKQTDSIKPTVKTPDKIVCGIGTVMKNNVCVLDPTSQIQEKTSSKGGGCLIATATYGSELSPQVQQLRELRDNQLLNTESGSAFMESFNDFYYSFSPIIADYERENPVFREMVKIAITPMVSSLSILNYVDMDSEIEVLGYGVALIMLNVGMYFGIPAIIIMRIRK